MTDSQMLFGMIVMMCWLTGYIGYCVGSIVESRRVMKLIQEVRREREDTDIVWKNYGSTEIEGVRR